MTPHLTHEQLSDLILTQPTADFHEAGRLDMLRDHLRSCERCSSDLAQLRDSLAAFRSTADGWATSEWSRPRTSQLLLSTPPRAGLWGSLPLPALWAAAATLVVAITLPLALHHDSPATPKTPAATVTPQPQSSQSDEALLEEIDETLSSSIPSPMQPLDDPTAGRHNQLNDQRKN
ncbi:hypothetical protein [Edaphobacter aggregans]|uniref:hypothetical protein n=1 Tax=Edaphobacter aggregans TaxID=570835 RepID=UPI000551B8D2|nr:hypothetical protein [Edaphobacter aggregans]